MEISGVEVRGQGRSGVGLDEFEIFRARALSGGTLMALSARRSRAQHDVKRRSKTPDGRMCRQSFTDGNTGLVERLSPEGQSDITSACSIPSHDYHADVSDVESLRSHRQRTSIEHREAFEIPRCRSASSAFRKSTPQKTFQSCITRGRSDSMSPGPKCVYILNSHGNPQGAKSLQKICDNINWDWNVTDEDEFFLGEMRPRVCSMPTSSVNQTKNCKNRFIAISRARATKDNYKVRSFSISKHGIVKPEGQKLVPSNSSSLHSIDSGTTSTTTLSPPGERDAYKVILCGLHNVGKKTLIKVFSASIGPDRVFSSVGKIWQGFTCVYIVF